MRIGLVGCVKTKGPVAAPARELYRSPLFAGRRRHVEESCDRWFILSALHGLVGPDEVIEPYDESLVAATVEMRGRWAERVLAAIDQALGDVGGLVFEVHAGGGYRDFGLVDGLRRRGAEVVNPTAGLGQGQQLAFYAGRSPSPAHRTSTTPPQRRGASETYSGVADWLAGQPAERVTVRFADLEAVLGRALPASARRHRPWWANSDRSPQGRSWLAAGRRVAAVDLAAETVTFERAVR